ncbi:hypothetical protein PIECOFPK_02885 [Mycovorax composti]|uniref:Uncharacterized protein n=1 Tax=Mycovorax composti TaxID=2962693 RepID=A0ABZ2EPD5_9BACT
MKLYSLLIFLLFIIVLQASAQYDIVVCGDDKVVILDGKEAEKGDTVIKWRWQVSEAASIPQQYQKWLFPLDECKSLEKGKKLLLTSSSGGVVLLDVATKKILFYAYAPMAHSAAPLPGNKIAVALSTHRKGNSIELYDVSEPEKVLYKDSLYSGHGVVWNKRRKRVFALGFDVLRCYQLKDAKTMHASLTLEKSWKLPSEGGHDLYAIDDNFMLITTHDNVYLFDIKKEKFTVFDLLADQHNVKSVNYNKRKKRLIYTQAEKSWWAYHVRIKNPDVAILLPNIKVYKARVIE